MDGTYVDNELWGIQHFHVHVQLSCEDMLLDQNNMHGLEMWYEDQTVWSVII